VLGLELSRLSRSNKDWHQLIDVCGIFNTLLCEQDAVYDPLDSSHIFCPVRVRAANKLLDDISVHRIPPER